MVVANNGTEDTQSTKRKKYRRKPFVDWKVALKNRDTQAELSVLLPMNTLTRIQRQIDIAASETGVRPSLPETVNTLLDFALKAQERHYKNAPVQPQAATVVTAPATTTSEPSAAQTEARMLALVQFVKDHPGASAKDIRESLNFSQSNFQWLIGRARKRYLVSMQGTKGSARYYANS
jgi:hypothetical protein